nr:hypothetical protein CFP56_78752 [Quercus suber]
MMKYLKFRKSSLVINQVKMLCSGLMCSPVFIQPNPGTTSSKQKLECQPLQGIKLRFNPNHCGKGYGNWLSRVSSEDVIHSLWSCPGLTRVWEDDPQWAFRSTTRFQNFPQVLLYVLDSDCSDDMFAMLIWNIWFRRNQVRTSPPGWPLDQVAQQAYQSLQEFRSA